MKIKEDYTKKFVSSTERAAYGASLFVGKGDKIAADKAAVNEMREVLNNIDMKGKVVIGEGELDEAPMLYIGEILGTGRGEELDIAVDPLEGTNFVAKNLPNALSVVAVTKKGNLLHAPETYMEKICIGEGYSKNLVDLDNSIRKNIENLADEKGTNPTNITACVLNRPRHKEIIDELNSLGVKIKLISDGDVSGAISVAIKKFKIDIYIGIGGGPEGVLAAAALKCLNSQMQTRLVFQNKKEKERSKKFGISDLNKKYSIEDMVKGDVIFCATGITDGELLKGIKSQSDKFESETYLLHLESKTNKIIKNITKK